MFETISYPASRFSAHDDENVRVWYVGVTLFGSLDEKFYRLAMLSSDFVLLSAESERAAVLCVNLKDSLQRKHFYQCQGQISNALPFNKIMAS